MRLVIKDLFGKFQFRSIVILLVALLGSLNYYSIDAARNEVRCSSIDIRNSPYFGSTGFKMPNSSNDLECTIVEGDFTLSMITEDGISDDMFPVFKNLREITGAILVFQIKGLTSLGKMFPNLRVIGGYSLIMNYALVIYQNQDLRNVGLTKLSVIKNGGIRIAENSRLCYTRNINWENMIVGNLRDVILDTVESQCQDQCVVADESKCHRPRPGVISCWNSTECQTHCKHYKYENGTFGPGCDDDGNRCHDYCLGGCTQPNDRGACHTCRYVEIHGMCDRNCPADMYEQLGRRCLTKEQCHKLQPMANSISTTETAWKAFNGKCHHDCPSGYEEDPKDNRNCVKCIGHCPKKCKGDENIDSVGAALKFRDCNIIDGFLEIEIRIGNEVNAEKFSEAFGELEEVTGYLMIRFSSVFVSLHMFKKLRVIHGNHLWRGVYALIVFDNQNLRELFNLKRQNLTIAKGKVQFQNNRMLCYNKIEEFLNHIGKLKEVTDIDVSTYSNGEKAVCDEMPLEVEVTFVYSDGFSIRWTPFNTTDLDYRKFIGYQIYYKKVDKIDEELSIDEDRSACADTWKMQFSEAATSDGTEDASKSQTGGELINGIEANTLYAFYVQTRIVNHPGARNAISKVHFVKTHFGNPDPPRIRVYRARGPDRIEMQWDPPLAPQGVITHYTIQWQPPEQSDHFEELNGCSDEVHKPNNKGLLSKKSKKPGTCSAIEGCCDCSLLNNSATLPEEPIPNPNDVFTEEMELTREERDAFENAIQNKVFVQSCQVTFDPLHCGTRPPPVRDPPWPPVEQHSKRRRHINFSTHSNKRSSVPKASPFKKWDDDKKGKVRARRQAYKDDLKMDPAIVKEIIAKNETAFNISVVHVDDPSFSVDFRTSGKINITGNRLLITGLPHFTEYVVLIYACQDINEPDNSCSARPAWSTTENDKVIAETVHVLNVTNGKENDRRLNWQHPESPNGIILAYRVKLFRGDMDTTPLFKCINKTQFSEEEGITFSGLAGGVYSIEIRTVTLAGVGMPTLVKDIFSIYSPIMTRKAMLILGASLLLFTLVLAGIIYFVFKYYCQKMNEDKVHQLLSSNPEYLSQIDVYKKDEWEIPREYLTMGKEIGSGTFGKVFRGIGRNPDGEPIACANGASFGECAIKTISEKDGNMDRLHFLVEASVMKQFNTSFIVKLYGVVSDIPVLVVMELMEKGNLRDFLRAHRPDSEENAGSRYSLPTPEQYYHWAAQIADGMAYLESLRFCHRDLAARNCMVHADESVKIGDFGMARDIYYTEYYKPQGRRLMPIRWLSPESLKDGKFTMKSDVWSFGIVLYEMLTLGQQPYAGLANNQVFNYVCVQRRVMVRPKCCPDIWFNMMRACWLYDPRERPCFWQIVDYLKNVTNKQFHERSFVYNDLDLKRHEGGYTFIRSWANDGTSNDGSYEERLKGEVEEESVVEEPPEAVEQDSNSCSCSECSNNKRLGIETEFLLEPAQKRNVRDYLNSITNSTSTSNDIDLEKQSRRDTERLIPDQTDEDEYVLEDTRAITDSFGGQSTASTSRMGGQQRPTLQSVAENNKNRQTPPKSKNQDPEWPESQIPETSTNKPNDYLVSNNSNPAFNKGSAVKEA